MTMDHDDVARDRARKREKEKGRKCDTMEWNYYKMCFKIKAKIRARNEPQM